METSIISSNKPNFHCLHFYFCGVIFILYRNLDNEFVTYNKIDPMSFRSPFHDKASMVKTRADHYFKKYLSGD